jgi:ribosomal peptide maturation radical SAM protein 1
VTSTAGRAARAPPPKVVLVSMPWTTVLQPSLGLGVLCAELRAQGVACRAFHANLLLLKHLRPETYDALAHADVLNEFLFTAPFDVLDEGQLDALCARCKLLCASNRNPSGYRDPARVYELVLALRDEVVPAFLAECAERVLEMEPTLVGLTCLFDQTIASAALARLLKDMRPDLPIVLGGYAVQHENGLEVLKAFPQIDAIARGDGEPVIARLAKASVGEGSFDTIPGVVTRANRHAPRSARRADLRKSLPPDYDDWFADVADLAEREKLRVFTEALPLESSRGCWWGQQSHCTFCGIDEETLKYRAKAPEQVLAEIGSLRERYGVGYPLRFSDYIFPHHYHETLLPELAKLEPPAQIECEIKANQTRARLRAFAFAGFAAVQPGIESFSTAVLKRMDKGVRAIQNVQLLKWGFLDGVVINYNLIFGFPGDTPDEYRELAANMPRLYHLTPPVSRSEVALTRFAPLYETPERFGLTKARAHAYYDVLFSRDFLERTGFQMDNYCYYFDRNFDFTPELAELYTRLVIQVSYWKKRQVEGGVMLAYKKANGRYAFVDTRFAQRETFVIEGVAAALYAVCDSQAIGTEEAIARTIEITGSTREAALEALDELDRRRVVWQSDRMVLGLGVPSEIAVQRHRQGWRLAWPALAPLLRKDRDAPEPEPARPLDELALA